MNAGRIKDPEGDLLNVIYDISPLEWRKYQHRYPETMVGKRLERVDRSDHPPFVAFRFECESESVIDALRVAVETYAGRLPWVLYAHKRYGLPGTNWVIHPRRLEEVREEADVLGLTPNTYLAEREPNFASGAYDDLEGLAKHVRQHFERTFSRNP